jgi:integrase
MSTKRLLNVPVRTPWHEIEHEKPDGTKQKTGLWAMSLGVRGCRVRVTQRARGGEFIAVTWVGGRTYQRSLTTKKRSEAERLAEAFLLKIHENDAAAQEPLTLRRLWELYREKSAGYGQNTERTKKDKASAIARLLAAFGEKKRVDQLTPNDVDRYLASRKAGIGWRNRRAKASIGARASADDLCLLRAMLRWALNERRLDGTWLLDQNPLRGVKLPKEESPLRPVISHDRYERMRAAAQELGATAHKEAGRVRWLRFELALVIAEATGARIGSIRGMRRSDLDLKHHTMRYDPEFHKRRREVIVPITRELADELRGLLARLGVVGDAWLFPRSTAEAPWPREIFRQLWIRAEEHAELPHLKGGCFHMLRRKWAIERKGLSPVDVAGAGVGRISRSSRRFIRSRRARGCSG